MWLVFVAAAGYAQKPLENVHGASELAAQAYARAQAAYQATQMKTVPGPARAAGLAIARAELEKALQLDPHNPLLLHRMGRLRAELGEWAQAADALGRSVSNAQATQDWAPGWLALADLELAQGHLQAAAQHLDAAARALQSLDAIFKKGDAPPKPLILFGIDLTPRPEKVDGPSRRQRAALMVAWMYADEIWSVEGSTLTSPAQGSPEAVLARAGARIELSRVRLGLAAGGGSGQALAAIQAALDKVPDLFEARMEQAVLLTRIGAYDQANRVFDAHLADPSPIWRNYPPVLQASIGLLDAWLSAATDLPVENVDRLRERRRALSARLASIVNPPRPTTTIVTTRPVDKLAHLPTPSEAGQEAARRAVEAYQRVQMHELAGLGLAVMREALPLADAALQRDPESPLFLSVRGRLLLAAGESVRARAALAKATELLPCWAPGWLDLAAADAREGKLDAAAENLRRAGEAAAELATLLHDPTPGPKEAWLDAYLKVEATLEVGSQGLSGRELSTTAAVLARVRARIALAEVILDAQRSPGPAGQSKALTGLEAVYKLDRDWIEIPLTEARLRLGLGEHKPAVNLLVPYADSSSAVHRNHPRLLLLLAQAYTEWFAAGGADAGVPRDELAQKAGELLGRLDSGGACSGEVAVGFSRLLIATALAYQKKENLQAAEDLLAKAQPTGVDTSSTRAALADARRRLGVKP